MLKDLTPHMRAENVMYCLMIYDACQRYKTLTKTSNSAVGGHVVLFFFFLLTSATLVAAIWS